MEQIEDEKILISLPICSALSAPQQQPYGSQNQTIIVF
jgi:hypothetical protein